jgi:hypothetical protein
VGEGRVRGYIPIFSHLPFAKGGKIKPSLCQREVGRDLKRFFQTAKLIQKRKFLRVNNIGYTSILTRFTEKGLKGYLDNGE